MVLPQFAKPMTMLFVGLAVGCLAGEAQAGRGQIAFGVTCRTGMCENPVSARVTANEGGPAGKKFDEQLGPFAKGTTAATVAAAFAAKMQEKGFPVKHEAGSESLFFDNVSQLDGGTSDGRQLEISYGGDPDVKTETAGVKITGNVSAGGLYLFSAAVAAPTAEREDATLRTSLVVELEPHLTGEQILDRIQIALIDAGFIVFRSSGSELTVLNDSQGRLVVGFGATPIQQSNRPNDIEWAIMMGEF